MSLSEGVCGVGVTVAPHTRQLRPETQIPPHVGERYIDLMCQFKPEALDFFLRNSGHYRVEEALTVREGPVGVASA